MKFSKIGSKYFTKMHRNNDFVIDLDEMISYLRRNKIPEFEKIIQFQINFSGIELTINNDKSSKFQAYLISKEDIRNNNEIEYLIIDNKYYFFCGDHKTAQCWFVLSETGELCTYNNSDETINIIYTSFEKYIETYAFIHLIKQNKKYEYPNYFNLLDENSFNELIKNYINYDSSNDKFNSWLSNGDLIINKGVWLHDHSFYIHLYGNNKSDCEKYLEILNEKKIILYKQ